MTAAAGATIVNYWTVGFTGHRHLDDPELIAGAIHAALTELGSQVDGQLAAVSSVASGGDTLFAQQALHMGLPFVALLPFPQAEFAKDFNAAQWSVAEECLRQALVVEIVSPEAERPGAYYEAGIRTVEECDILLTVWDGRQGGEGGTGEMVQYARQRRKSLIWIDSKTGEVTRERYQARMFRDHLLDTVIGARSRSVGAAPSSSFLDFFEKLDASTSARLPRLRSREARAVRYHYVAVLIAVLAMALHISAYDFIAVKCAFVILAFGMLLTLHFAHLRRHSVQARLVTEICRSMLAIWSFPGRFSSLYRVSVPGFDHLVRCLLINRDREKRGPAAIDSLFDLGAFRRQYIRHRLRKQRAYYKWQSLKSSPLAKWYSRAALGSSFLAVVATIFLALMGWRETRGNPFPEVTRLFRSLTVGVHGVAPDSPEPPLLLLLAVAGPLAASFFTTLVVINEYGRRHTRYREMERLLFDAEVRMRHAVTLRATRSVLEETERTLLEENYQWYYQAMAVEVL